MRKAGRRKPKSAPKWEDMYETLSHENTIVQFYNSGMIKIQGNIKYGAMAFAKHILESTTGKGSMNYLCMRIHLKDKYTLEWVAEENDLKHPEPEFWEEFKREFERFCELKAFL